MTYALFTDGIASDTTLDLLYSDPGMGPGTLILVDPAHSESGLTAGVVPTSGTVRNLARDQAATIVGGGAVAADMDMALTYLRSAGDASFRVERTLKGGIHGISSQVGQTSAALDIWSLAAQTALATWLLNAVPGGSLYFSLWYRSTRAYSAGYGQAPMFFMTDTSNYLMHTQSGFPTTPAQLGRTPTAAPAVGAATFIAQGCNAWTGTKPAIGALRQSIGTLGRNANYSAALLNKAQSAILYRMKVEDLTRTKRANSGAGGTPAEEYAAALAADQAQFTTAFAAGGKFYGDTWSDPATLLA
ncbi:MAG: hypothetical protein J0I31_19195 [Rhizobiales bacterium]|nr:hypothetical protein [Hyphomicrobiales bacterium]